MDIRRILVIYKKSVYELYALESEDPSFLAYLEQEEEARERIINAHHDNLDAIESVCSALEAAGVEYECDHRARKRSLSGFDAVVTIGGDGTLLDASHAIRDVPVLGGIPGPLQPGMNPAPHSAPPARVSSRRIPPEFKSLRAVAVILAFPH